MRIGIVELQCEDIMWFGVDKYNCVFECTSAGSGNVPEFVCQSKEETDELVSFFLDELDKMTEEYVMSGLCGMNQLIEDCITLAQKGIYCYDISEDDGHENEYKKIVEPVEPLRYEDLPKPIRGIMQNHRVDVDVRNGNYIKVPHAY